jgi:hypothetical protein
MKNRITRVLALAVTLTLAAPVFAHAGRPSFGGRASGGFEGGGRSYHDDGGSYSGDRPSFAFGGTRDNNNGYHYRGSYRRGALGYYYSYPYYDYDDGGYDNAPTYSSSDYDGDSQVISQVQSALIKLGYYHGDTTGIIGPRTSTAISNYQRDNGLPITGTVTGEVVHSLNLD